MYTFEQLKTINTINKKAYYSMITNIKFKYKNSSV